MSSVSEKLLEDEITAHLVAEGGYPRVQGRDGPKMRQDFDARLGFDTAELFAFHQDRPASQLGQASQGPWRRRGACAPAVHPAARPADR